MSPLDRVRDLAAKVVREGGDASYALVAEPFFQELITECKYKYALIQVRPGTGVKIAWLMIGFEGGEVQCFPHKMVSPYGVLIIGKDLLDLLRSKGLPWTA